MTTSPTAVFLARAIDASGLSQKEIARRCGFRKSNMISMMRTGGSPVPLARIPELARVLSVDVETFMRCALAEYAPQVLEVLGQGTPAGLSSDERELVALFREAQRTKRVTLTPDIAKLVEIVFRQLVSIYGR